MSHTPGPWAVREAEGDELYEVYREAGGELITYAAATTRRRVNAILIAAAPDLLFACRCALADLEGMCELVEEDHPCFETIEELKVVIEKAEGGE